MQQIPFLSLFVATGAYALNCQPINEIQFFGLKHTKEFVVLRELHQGPDSCYDSLAMQQALQRLKSLDLFAEIRSSWDSENKKLQLHFTELPQGLILPALGKTDKDGWNVGVQSAFLNLGGRDIRLEARWTSALEPRLFARQEGFAQISSPWLGTIPLDYQFVYAKVHSQQKDWLEKSNRGEMELNYPSNAKIQANLRGDFYQVDTSQSPAWQVPLYAGLGGGVRWDHRDASGHPKKGSTAQQLFQFFGPAPAQSFLWQSDMQIWLPLSKSFVFQTGLLSRQRWGTLPHSALYQTGGPNSLRSYRPDDLGEHRNEALFQSEMQWRILNERSFKLPILNWDLYTGMDFILGFEDAYLSQKDQWDGEHWPGLVGGVHLFVPGFERIRFELGYPLRGNSGPQFWIGLFQKINTQLWTRR